MKRLVKALELSAAYAVLIVHYVSLSLAKEQHFWVDLLLNLFRIDRHKPIGILYNGIALRLYIERCQHIVFVSSEGDCVVHGSSFGWLNMLGIYYRLSLYVSITFLEFSENVFRVLGLIELDATGRADKKEG